MCTMASVTNQRVADDLGISHSMVSRIRSGDRMPSLRLVHRICNEFGWPVDQQVSTLDPKVYAERFEDLLSRRYV